jgi:hypothetical protein
MEVELAALDTAIVEADWLRELLMDLPIVKKPLPAILMNCDNQTVSQSRQFKGRYEVIKKYQKMVKVCQKNEKLWGYYIGLYPY